MNDLKDQVNLWNQESWNYFERNYGGKKLNEIPINSYLKHLLQIYPLTISAGGRGSILEIGCGAGNNLNHLRRLLGAGRVVGTEPSSRVIQALRRAFPEMEFYVSDSISLPFHTNEFDMVILRSVLHWIDRNYLMQTLGEAIRVTKQYLIVSDFAPHQPYSVIYKHVPQWRTFKMAYQQLIEATHCMRLLSSLYSNDGDEWKSVQTLLFRKVPTEDAFPLQREEDFQKG